jgi:acyl-CoA thioester hydrolase
MPLRSRDEFVSKLSVRKEGVRYVFLQDIFRLPDMKLVARGRVDTVCLVQGRLKECAELEKYLEPYFDKEG